MDNSIYQHYLPQYLFNNVKLEYMHSTSIETHEPHNKSLRKHGIIRANEIAILYAIQFDKSAVCKNDVRFNRCYDYY